MELLTATTTTAGTVKQPVSLVDPAGTGADIALETFFHLLPEDPLLQAEENEEGDREGEDDGANSRSTSSSRP